MKTTLIQTHLYWEDREKNLSHFNTLIDSIKENTDLIVLPEMFTTGFTMNPEKNAEPANGETLQWLKQKAKEKSAVITGSVAVEENGYHYNRLFWVEPTGKVSSYNKHHLFRMAKEDQHYTAGSEKIIMPIKDWKVCPLVCYDLRFPVWSRNRFGKQLADGSHKSAVGSDLETNSWTYDVLVYVANWPEVRSYAWKQLLIARAIENQCYVIGVNRIGKDGNDYAHAGDSVVVNPRGGIISHTKHNEESVETILLDRSYLNEFRNVFPVGLDADDFDLKS
jgi:omega-amidase